MSRIPVVPFLAGGVVTAWLVGCTDPSQRCQLETAAGACVSVISVVPTVFSLSTSNVDVVRDICEDGGTIPDEPFTDRDAVITIDNEPPVSLTNTPSLGPAVVFDHYSISFKLETSVGPSPPLSDVAGELTATVLGGQQVGITYPLVPLATKAQFIGEGGSTDTFPSYAAEYTLFGSDGNDPSSTFSLVAKTTFSIGDFDNCGVSTTQ